MYIVNYFRVLDHGCICCNMTGFLWWIGSLFLYSEKLFLIKRRCCLEVSVQVCAVVGTRVFY